MGVCRLFSNSSYDRPAPTIIERIVEKVMIHKY